MGSVIARVRAVLVWLCVAAIIAVPLWFAAAGLGSRAGLWDWRFGLEVMVGETGPRVLIGAIGLAAFTLLVSAVSQAMKDVPRSAGGFLAASVLLLIGGVGLYQLNAISAQAARLPAMHDITTDTADPPQFTASLIARRGEGANSVVYEGKTDGRNSRPLPEVQAEAYRDLQPIVLSASPEAAYAAALEIARQLGWTVSTASPQQKMFEATATSFWFGFRDDVVVRVTEREDGGSVVDARSVSRERDADRGANAARLRTFAARLRAELGEG